MIGFPIGILYSNAVEWVVHKYLLHGRGKRKSSIFSFHWSNHHRNARRFAMADPDYHKPIWNWESRGREVAAIAFIVGIHAPFVAVAPWFAGALFYSGVNYLYKHKKSHVDIEWGKRHMPHHYDHHMGKNQDANWCVTQPWTDWVLGTRVKYDYPAVGSAGPEELESWEPSEPAVAAGRLANPAVTPAQSAADSAPIEVATPEGTAEATTVAERSNVFNKLAPEDVREPLDLPAPSRPPRAA